MNVSVLDKLDVPFIARLGQHQPGPDTFFTVAPSELVASPEYRFCLQTLVSCIDIEWLAAPNLGFSKPRTKQTSARSAFDAATLAVKTVAFGVPQRLHPCQNCTGANHACFMTNRLYSGQSSRCLRCQRARTSCKIDIEGVVIALSSPAQITRTLDAAQQGQLISSIELFDQYCRELDWRAGDYTSKEIRELVDLVLLSCCNSSFRDDDTGNLHYRFKLASTCAAFPAASPGQRGEVALPFPVATAVAHDMLVDDPFTGAIDDMLFDHTASVNGVSSDSPESSDDGDSKLVDLADVDWQGACGDQADESAQMSDDQDELYDFAGGRAVSVESGSSRGNEAKWEGESTDNGIGSTVDRAVSVESGSSDEKTPDGILDPDDNEIDIPRYDDPDSSGSEDDAKPLGPASPARRRIQREIERFFESKTLASPLKGSWQ